MNYKIKQDSHLHNCFNNFYLFFNVEVVSLILDLIIIFYLTNYFVFFF